MNRFEDNFGGNAFLLHADLHWTFEDNQAMSVVTPKPLGFDDLPPLVTLAGWNAAKHLTMTLMKLDIDSDQMPPVFTVIEDHSAGHLIVPSIVEPNGVTLFKDNLPPAPDYLVNGLATMVGETKWTPGFARSKTKQLAGLALLGLRNSTH
jgi:hypothetical protein